MGVFRPRRRDAGASPMSSPAPDDHIDLARFERLLDASVRLRERGVDFETIRERAAEDEVSLNAALEAIDREQDDV